MPVPAAVSRLMVHAWPGNLRELKSALAFAAVLSEGAPRAEPEHLPPGLRASPAETPALAPESAGPAAAGASLETLRREALERALARQGGNVSAAARELGLARSTVYRLARRYGLAAR
jgi:transcriptional regulator of acetoin/glycerol metabolism